MHVTHGVEICSFRVNFLTLPALRANKSAFTLRIAGLDGTGGK